MKAPRLPLLLALGACSLLLLSHQAMAAEGDAATNSTITPAQDPTVQAPQSANDAITTTPAATVGSDPAAQQPSATLPTTEASTGPEAATPQAPQQDSTISEELTNLDQEPMQVPPETLDQRKRRGWMVVYKPQAVTEAQAAALVTTPTTRSAAVSPDADLAVNQIQAPDLLHDSDLSDPEVASALAALPLETQQIVANSATDAAGSGMGEDAGARRLAAQQSSKKRPFVRPLAAEKALRRMGVIPMGSVHFDDAPLTFDVFASQKDALAVKRYAKDAVLRVERDARMTILQYSTQTGAAWGLDRIDQRNMPLSGSYSYLSANQGTGSHVFVIDTGIRYSHSEYSGRVLPGATYYGTTAADNNGHGSHCAGTIAGTTYGVAKKATLVPVKVCDANGSCPTSNIIGAVNWAISKAKALGVVNRSVISMSLGGSYSQSLNTAIQSACNAGIVVVVAAGNDNRNAANYSPASQACAVTVGATTSTDARASYSNYGSVVDVFAPGSSIKSAWYTSDAATNTISGTSMATPHVAGFAAILRAAYPSASQDQIQATIKSTATAGKVTNAGSGSPNRLLYAQV